MAVGPLKSASVSLLIGVSGMLLVPMVCIDAGRARPVTCVNAVGQVTGTNVISVKFCVLKPLTLLDANVQASIKVCLAGCAVPS